MVNEKNCDSEDDSEEDLEEDLEYNSEEDPTDNKNVITLNTNFSYENKSKDDVIKIAKDKIKNEIAAFREKTQNLEPKNLYRAAGDIILIEATFVQLEKLTDDESLSNLVIKEGKTLEDAVQHIVNKFRCKNEQMWELPIEEFKELLWEYYIIDPEIAKKAMESKRVIPTYKPLVITNHKTPEVAKAKKGAQQVSLFDMMTGVK